MSCEDGQRPERTQNDVEGEEEEDDDEEEGKNRRHGGNDDEEAEDDARNDETTGNAAGADTAGEGSTWNQTTAARRPVSWKTEDTISQHHELPSAQSS